MITFITSIVSLIASAGGGGSSSGGGGGGGGSSGGGSGGGDFTLLDFVFVLIMLGVVAINTVRISKANRKRQQIEAQQRQDFLARVQQAGAEDPVWNMDYMRQSAEQIFMAYQRDWSSLDMAATKRYLTPEYAAHVELMLEAFRDCGRRNETIVRSLKAVDIYDAKGIGNSGGDQEFTADITAMVTDIVWDTVNNQKLTQSSYRLCETWVFKRSGNQWLLDGIIQPTADESTREQSIRRFAEQNHAYYLLDWGRMLLPQTGQIFRPDSMKVADVNNHVLGRLLGTGRAIDDAVVYQIYTYSQQPYHQAQTVYLVGQLAVPKHYGNILIRRRKHFMRKRVRGMSEVSLEANDFNRKYQVLASQPDQIASFELLHPAMMAALIDAPFEINLEVIDNSIYF